MAPLIIIIACFGITLVINKFLLNDRFSLSFIGRFSLAIMLLFTGIAHFAKTDLMIEMMPEIVPLKKETVYLTGILEILASVGLVVTQKFAKLSSIMLILFFLAILPANIIGSIEGVELGGMEKGVKYLYFRIPLQILFIIWTYYFGIKINKTTANKT